MLIYFLLFACLCLLCISLANFYHLFNLFPIVDSTDSDSDDFPLLNPCLWSLAVFGWFQLALFFQSTSSQIFQNTSDTSLAYAYLWFSNFQVVHNGQVRNIGPSKLVAATLTDLTHYFFIDGFFFNGSLASCLLDSRLQSKISNFCMLSCCVLFYVVVYCECCMLFAFNSAKLTTVNCSMRHGPLAFYCFYCYCLSMNHQLKHIAFAYFWHFVTLFTCVLCNGFLRCHAVDAECFFCMLVVLCLVSHRPEPGVQCGDDAVMVG